MLVLENIPSTSYRLNGVVVGVVHGEYLRYRAANKGSVCMACYGGLFDDVLAVSKKEGLEELPLDPNDILYDYKRSQRDQDDRYGIRLPMSVYQCNTCGLMTGPWVAFAGQD